MTDQTETIQKIKDSLEPYIKPREQVNYIRRVLALHIGTCSRDGPIQHPQSLVDSSHDVVIPSDVTGVFREYAEALQANVAARRQLDSALQSSLAESVEPPRPPASNTDLLEDRLCLLRLHQKREILHAVRQSLDLLMEKPAATQEFLDIKHMFQGIARLPSVPSDVINGLVADQSSPRSDLTERVNQLEKTVLRAKLMLKHEEQALRDARARSKGKHDAVSNGARLKALNATRNELISWIEGELGKASVEEADGDARGNAQGNGHRSRASPSMIATRLREISGKYAKYVASRKLVLDLGAQLSQPSLLPPAQPAAAAGDRDNSTPAIPTDHLLTPYLAALLAISGKQKATIGQKTFINSTLGKQNQEACQLLGRLGEESHLVPAYPMKDALRRRSGIQHEIVMRSSEQPDIASRIKPWVFAADSAKIATLEYVAETVEGGQLALENSMSALREIDILLGRDSGEPSDDTDCEERSEEDVWLAAGTSKKGTWKQQTAKQSITQEKSDIWSRLHGSLGLPGQEDVV